MLGRDRLGDRLKRVNVPAGPSDDLSNLRRHRGDLNDNSPFAGHPVDPDELRAIHQGNDDALNQFQDGGLGLLVQGCQLSILPFTAPVDHLGQGFACTHSGRHSDLPGP